MRNHNHPENDHDAGPARHHHGPRFRPEWPDDEADAPRGRRGHRRPGPMGPGMETAGGPMAGMGRGMGPMGGMGPTGGPGGPRGWRGRGGRPRGDVRAAILLLLDEQPRHGYELIQEIAARSNGAWTPSPGSVYPTLQALEDEGLVTIQHEHGRRTASLTDDGVAYVAANHERLGTPWATTGIDVGAALALRHEILALKDAVAQMARVGTPAQQTATAAILTRTRKDVYRLLADGDTEPPTGAEPGSTTPIG